MSYKNILVTGGSGFIGSAFIDHVFDKCGYKGNIINLDALTYAGNPANLEQTARQHPDRYFFVNGDIRDASIVKAVFDEHKVDALVHFAAESHVDRSIDSPGDFITTNVIGTFKLLEQARLAWGHRSDVRFHHVSTDEVFGSLGPTGKFSEETPYDPHSPYSASKAASDHLVRAYYHTYGLPIIMTNCSNNYGPRQFPEKLIPVMIEEALKMQPLPIYGDGMNIRDWLYVDDHADALWKVLNQGKSGETYVIGGHNEWTNIDLVKLICRILAEEMGKPADHYTKLISFVKDRPGHDRRYAIDSTKLEKTLNWFPSRTMETGMRETIRWYLANRQWVESVKSGEYLRWREHHYQDH